MTGCADQRVRTAGGWVTLSEWVRQADARDLVPVNAEIRGCALFRVCGVLAVDPDFTSAEAFREIGAGRAVLQSVRNEGILLRLPEEIPVRVEIYMPALHQYGLHVAPPSEAP